MNWESTIWCNRWKNLSFAHAVSSPQWRPWRGNDNLKYEIHQNDATHMHSIGFVISSALFARFRILPTSTHFDRELIKRHLWTSFDFGGGFMQVLMLSRTCKCIYYICSWSFHLYWANSRIGHCPLLWISHDKNHWRSFPHLLEKRPNSAKKLFSVAFATNISTVITLYAV